MSVFYPNRAVCYACATLYCILSTKVEMSVSYPNRAVCYAYATVVLHFVLVSLPVLMFCIFAIQARSVTCFTFEVLALIAANLLIERVRLSVWVGEHAGCDMWIANRRPHQKEKDLRTRHYQRNLLRSTLYVFFCCARYRTYLCSYATVLFCVRFHSGRVKAFCVSGSCTSVLCCCRRAVLQLVC